MDLATVFEGCCHYPSQSLLVNEVISLSLSRCRVQSSGKIIGSTFPNKQFNSTKRERERERERSLQSRGVDSASWRGHSLTHQSSPPVIGHIISRLMARFSLWRLTTAPPAASSFVRFSSLSEGIGFEDVFLNVAGKKKSCRRRRLFTPGRDRTNKLFPSACGVPPGPRLAGAYSFLSTGGWEINFFYYS